MFSSRVIPISLLIATALALLCLMTTFAQPEGAISELTDLRTATSKTWLNSDRSRTVEIYSGPIHYKNESDTWQDIDTTLGPADKAGFANCAVENRFKTRLASCANGWQEVEMNGITFGFTAESDGAYGSVRDSSVTYSDAWPDVDLKYQVTTTGIKEDIILKKQPEINEFRFIIDPRGLKPVTVGKGIDFVDTEGILRARIPAPFMYDADWEFSDAVTAAWKELPDGMVELVVHPDEEWLEQANYPVVIDPTIYITPDEGQDGDYRYSYGNYTGGGWYMDSTMLLMRYYPYTGQLCSIACIQFYIDTDIETGNLPRNAVVTAANISLYATGSVGSGRTVSMKRNLGEWPDGIPPDTGTTLASAAWSSVGYKSFSGANVIDMVQKWAWEDYDNYGVQLAGNAYPSGMQCYSGDYSEGYQPKLEVTYTPDATPPEDFTPTADPSGWTNADTIEIRFDTEDTESEMNHFEVAVDSGGYTSQTSPYNLDVSALSDGEHTVHVKAIDNAGNSRTKDVTIYLDNGFPTVTITHPPDGEIHKPAAADVKLIGTATDDLSGVDTVVVEIQHTGESTITPSVTYNSGTGRWECTWTDPAPDDDDGYTIVVTVTDEAGIPAIATRTVKVYDLSTVIYVDKNGDDTTGLSWDHAKNTVTAGLALASYDADIWVADGTYQERIALILSTRLYGGFAGDETYREQRDWNANVTILDGNQGGSVVTSPTNATTDTEIDGFTIQNGIGTVYDSERCGGGIYCNESSPKIINNIISGNDCPGTYGKGGGIYCHHSSPTISNNVITDNSARDGGGIYCQYFSSPMISSNNTITGNSAYNGGGIGCNQSFPTISYNIITDNIATGGGQGLGGGIYCYSDSNPTISNNTITGNSADKGGGGICCYDQSDPTISHNIITNNDTPGTYGGNDGYGGGIYIDHLCNPTIANNTITSNSAINGGAGICCDEVSSPEIRGNLIESNTITTGSGEGGGICCKGVSAPLIIANTIKNNNGGDRGGGISLNGGGYPRVMNNLFVGNYVSGDLGGGGIYVLDSAPRLINNTFVDNRVTSEYGRGGAIRLRSYSGSTIRNTFIKNNIFHDNQAAQGWSVRSDLSLFSPIAYCNAYNPNTNNYPSDHYVGAGDVDDDSCDYNDPLFVSTGSGNYLNGDYHLQSLSQCLDKGLNPDQIDEYLEELSSDLDGNDRPVDLAGILNYSATAYSDPGAYEKQE